MKNSKFWLGFFRILIAVCLVGIVLTASCCTRPNSKFDVSQQVVTPTPIKVGSGYDETWPIVALLGPHDLKVRRLKIDGCQFYTWTSINGQTSMIHSPTCPNH